MKIVHIPKKILRDKTQKIKDPISKKIQDLLPRMFKIMHEAHGVGLAAPQIGLGLRIAVIEISGKRIVLINPRITAHSREKILFEEGCLSIPEKIYSIVRASRVTARYCDEDGRKCKIKASGLFAIALQHEIDHLDGIVIADRYKQQRKERGMFSKRELVRKTK